LIEASSCGGIVIYRDKVLLLYKNHIGRYDGWVLPKGTVEKGESFKQTTVREVREEAGAVASIVKYVGKTRYTFKNDSDYIIKTVYWYLMTADSFYCKPQTEEHFAGAGYYGCEDAYKLLKYHDEKQALEKACYEYFNIS
jgi:8-oxo-dGTP pyrophosphatase MutT (NUDIX family)